jgi:PKD repeat protein
MRVSRSRERATLTLVLGALGLGAAAAWAQSTPAPTQRQLTSGEKTIVMKIILDTAAEPDDGTAPLAVKFSAKPSDDDEAVGAAYLWDFGDRSPLVRKQNPTHTYKKPGTYRATVKVTNKAGQIGTDDFTITVHAPGEE